MPYTSDYQVFMTPAGSGPGVLTGAPPSQQNFDIGGLLAKIGALSAGPSLPLSLGSIFGGNLLSGLGSALFPSRKEKDRRALFNMIRNNLGQTPIDPNQFLAKTISSILPTVRAESKRFTGQFGFSSGQAFQDMYANVFDQLIRQAMTAGLQAQQLNTQARLQRESILASLTR